MPCLVKTLYNLILFLLPAGRTDHVFCTHSMWVGHGCHFCHTYLPLGSGGLCRRTLLQGSQTNNEERTVWSEAAGDCLNARYKKWAFKSHSFTSKFMTHSTKKKIHQNWIKDLLQLAAYSKSVFLKLRTQSVNSTSNSLRFRKPL